MVSLFKKGDRENHSNDRSVTLLNLIGKLYNSITNNHLLKYLEFKGKLHEEQGAFRIGRSCIDNISSLNELIQGGIKEEKSTYVFFLDA